MTIPDTEFGARVRARLRDEQVIWLTTVAVDGTPQPNPVWFCWDGADEVLIYNDRHARRISRLGAPAKVSLNFNTDAGGDDVVVLTGTAQPAPDTPSPDANTAYLAKYADAITRIGMDEASFVERYDVPVRVRIEKARGF
jgi:PPOX class probable F420-dependent enzyme